MNKVFLIGNVTKDIKLQESQKGKYCFFTLAISTFNKDKDQITNYINLTAYSNVAENLAKFITKGSKIAVEGTISSYTKNENGINKNINSIIAQNVQFLNTKNKINQGKNIESLVKNNGEDETILWD